MLCFHASLIGISPSLHTTCVAGTPAFQLLPFDMAFHCAIVPLKLMVVSPLQPEKAPLFNPVRTRDPVRIFYKYNIINIIF